LQRHKRKIHHNK